tara:strand:- start:37 stop:153 length:117 start_codon:yes stop_codon:yes gene_type:complete
MKDKKFEVVFENKNITISEIVELIGKNNLISVTEKKTR